MAKLQLLYETTLQTLEKNAHDLPSKRGKSEHVVVKEMLTTPIKGNGDVGNLRFKFNVTSNNSGKQYNTVIEFENVEFDDKDTPANVTITGSDGEEYYIEPISLSHKDAKVRCTCMDFYFRFAQHNAKDGSLYGNPPKPYQRKTTTRPSANPDGKPGLCKHLMASAQYLHKQKIVTV